MKRTRTPVPSKTNKQKSPKGLYFLALFLLVAIGSAGFINTRNAMMENEIEKSFSLNSAQQETADMQVPHLPDLGDVMAPDIEEEILTEQEIELPADEEPSAPVAATDIQFTLPVSGDIARDFSKDNLVYNETTKDWRTHNALDIKAEQGTPVKAAASGTVENIYDDPLYGTTVIIRHSDNLVTKYCSLQPSLPVSIGNFVDAGAPIGNIGNTSAAEKKDGAHLHFEVVENGTPINPKDLF